MPHTVPEAPPGLGTAGRQLWHRVVTDSGLEFLPHEVVLLEEAAHSADIIAGLRSKLDPNEPDPQIVRELRLSAEALRKLLMSVPWPSSDGDTVSVSNRARRAAFARWHPEGG